MNKSELVAAIAAKTKQPVNTTEDTVNTLLEVVAAAVMKGDKIQLKTFGTFELVERAARTSRNPQTGAAIQVPAKKTPRAKLTFGKVAVAKK